MTKLIPSNLCQKPTFSQTAKTDNLSPKELDVNNLMSNRKWIQNSLLNTVSTKETSSTAACYLLQKIALHHLYREVLKIYIDQDISKYYVTTENLYACSTAIQALQLLFSSIIYAFTHSSLPSLSFHSPSPPLPLPLFFHPFFSPTHFQEGPIQHSVASAETSDSCRSSYNSEWILKKNQGTALKFGRAV